MREGQPPIGWLFLLVDRDGIERAAPVRTLVQKHAGESMFLARGRFHLFQNAGKSLWAETNHERRAATHWVAVSIGGPRWNRKGDTSTPA